MAIATLLTLACDRPDVDRGMIVIASGFNASTVFPPYAGSTFEAELAAILYPGLVSGACDPFMSRGALPGEPASPTRTRASAAWRRLLSASTPT